MSDALFEDLAREFEPLEKGVSPVTQVQGNMVCNDMHIVCAFDSDKVCLLALRVECRMEEMQWKIEYRFCYPLET